MGIVGVADSAIMPKYVALLRAINVGGHTVKMEYLRGLFEASGFASVETFIASGNVIFEFFRSSAGKDSGQAGDFPKPDYCQKDCRKVFVMSVITPFKEAKCSSW